MTSQAGPVPDGGGAVESRAPAVPRILTVEAMRSPGLRLINRRELLALVPLSERTILEMERRGAFPQRFTLTPRQVAWDVREIERWMAACREARGKISAP